MLDKMSSSLVLPLMSKPIKSSKLSNFCGGGLLCFLLLFFCFLCFLCLLGCLLCLLCFLCFLCFLYFLGLLFAFLISSAFLASSAFFLASSSRFFLAFFFDFQFVKFLFFSTITPRHHSASLSFDTVWSRIAWKFWISPLSSWVMDFWISSLLGLVITLLCFLFWSIISNMYPDDFNISSSELCSLVWRFSGMVGK